MRLRFWRRPEPEEPEEAEPTPEEPAEPEPARPARPPRQPASAFSRPYAPEEAREAGPVLPAAPPGSLSLTIEEAKTAIRAAGGDIIQIGFLARAYQRQREEEPGSRETAAARKRLCDLVAKRLRDRDLLEPQGHFELVEEPAARQDAAKVRPDGQ